MSSGFTKKPSHLTVVRDAGGRSSVVSLEKLTSDQAEKIKIYQQLIAPAGVLVGVMLGQEDWDLRPLILQKGVLTLSRFASPDFRRRSDKVNEFQEYVTRVREISPRTLMLSYGNQGDLFWITRKYYNTTLPEGLPTDPAKKLSLAKAVISYVDRLAKDGLVHGHIHPGNAALEGEEIMLFDHGFSLYDPNSEVEALAPELKAKRTVSGSAVDVYGLGVLLESILGDSQPALKNLTSVMQSTDPGLRPQLDQVISAFGEERRPVDFIPPTPTENRPKAPVAAEPGSPAREIKIALPSGNVILYLLLVVLLGVLIWQRRDYFTARPATTVFSNSNFETYWKSNQPALMQQVVRAALSGDPAATSLILDGALMDEKHPSVQNDFIKKAFNPAWANELGDEDKRTILKLALGNLVPADQRNLRNLADNHPGVILAIVGQLQIDPGDQHLATIPLSKLTGLPLPYGPAFAALEKIGPLNLQDTSAQALAHLLMGDLGDRSFLSFFPSGEDQAATLARLEVLLPLLDLQEGFDKRLFDSTMAHVGQGPMILQWFAKDQLVGWKAAPIRDKISLFTGAVSESRLSHEALADLLRFPRKNIREKAAELLSGVYSGVEYPGLLRFLASEESRLTRAQTIALLAALTIKSDAAYNFVSQWFETEPDPQSVLAVLLYRGNAPETDSFNLEAARYLAGKEWQVDLEMVKRLITHPEPLARALGYAKLRKDKREELELLRKAAESEKSDRIREQLKARLQP